MKNFLIELYLDIRILKAKLIQFFITKLDKETAHQYWTKPNDGHNDPINYTTNIEGFKRSNDLLSIIQNLKTTDIEILEIGCNSGRNLNVLYEADYKNLTGIEISENALKNFESEYPKCFQNIKIINKPIENCIKDFQEHSIDIVYTMAVLQHIHPASEWIFDYIAKITRGYLITCEVEAFPSPRHFPRNYKRIFEKRGMRQINRTHGHRIFKLD